METKVESRTGTAPEGQGRPLTAADGPGRVLNPLPAPRSDSSAFQNGEKPHFCCPKSPRLWFGYLVTETDIGRSFFLFCFFKKGTYTSLAHLYFLGTLQCPLYRHRKESNSSFMS